MARKRRDGAERPAGRVGKLRQFLASRVFFKVYFTVLASIAAVAIASGAYWSARTDREDTSWRERQITIAEELFPAGSDKETTQDLVTRFARALDADITLFSAGGVVLATAGRPLPMPRRPDRESGFDMDDGGRLVAPLKDGRVLVARVKTPWRGRGGGLGYVLLIAAVIAMIAYPVVRNLTRRLEAMREGVQKFGMGDLDARVNVVGTDEIAAMATEFNKSADRVERLVGGHRSLLANASHELRAPVTRLRMAVEMGDLDRSEVSRREVLDNLTEIDVLVEEILLASRLEAVGGRERFELVDLMAIAAEEGARHGISVSGKPAEVNGDPRLLMRLVRNLVLNAQRHGKPPIEIVVAPAGSLGCISVEDSGGGLPKGEEEKVFEPFYRPSGRSEAAGGWGLGLALVKQIAELHDGGVRYAPLDGGGARFVVHLPLVKPERRAK